MTGAIAALAVFVVVAASMAFLEPRTGNAARRPDAEAPAAGGQAMLEQEKRMLDRMPATRSGQ